MNNHPATPNTFAANPQSGGNAFDVIGDIHGQAGLLCSLLSKLGYHELDNVWRHPQRTAVFVGDIIDRGPEIRESLAIVRSMVRSGTALAVIGNHEWDALRFHLDPTRYSDLKSQLETTLAQFHSHEEEWQSCLEWFRTLPLSLDLGGFRVAHACWNTGAVESLRSLPCPLDDKTLRLLSDANSTEGRAAGFLINGLRLVLPGDLFVMTHRGMPMNWMRVKWWIPLNGRSYDDVAFPDLDMVPRKRIELPPADLTTPVGIFDGYPSQASPIFFGHYSLPRHSTPEPMTPNVACLDYSVWKGGSLVCYRWDGEQTLQASKFVTTNPTQSNP